MSQGLKDHLENNPQLKSVFLNKKGEWQFHKRAGYDKELSREEILRTDYESDGSENANPDEIQTKTKPGKLVPKKKADKKTENSNPE